MLRDGIEQYHSLLTDDLGGETQRQLDEQLQQRGLFFGDRALCTVLRPRFLSPSQYRFLQKRGAVVLRAFRTAHRAALEDEKLLAQFGLMEWEHQLVHVETGFRDASPVSRLDAFFTADQGGMKFTEYNAETPAGGGYNDVLTEVFYGLPIMREFLRSPSLMRTNSGRVVASVRTSPSSTGPTCPPRVNFSCSRSTSPARAVAATSLIPRTSHTVAVRCRARMARST
jgi:hypothetical protein